jgi:Regulator of ribonuclease activity B
VVADADFSADDRLQYDRAVMAGRDVSAPVGVTHFFSLASPGARPVATDTALAELGKLEVVADEELTGDGYWHVAAFGSLMLTGVAIRQVEAQMNNLAGITGVRYDGWQVTLNVREEHSLPIRQDRDQSV